MNVKRLFVVILEYVAFTATEFVDSVYEIKRNTSFANVPVDVVSANTLLDCVGSCLSKRCKAASYMESEEKCYLSNSEGEPTVVSSGFMLIPDRKYVYVNLKKSWADAKVYCQSIGGQLARIFTSSENERAKQLTSQTSPVWIDGNDIATEGVWLFSDGSPLQGQVTFNFWGPNQPNNFGGNQHCMCIYYFPTQNVFEWADESCSREFDFICEI